MNFRNSAKTVTRPPFSFDLDLARLVTRVAAKPDDTLEAVAADNSDVFRRLPDCDQRHAAVLRGLAIDLMLAGMEDRCGVLIENVVDDARGGFRVEPRFEDELLSWVIDGYEILSREEGRTNA